jgi:hypothetical protein
MVFWETNPLINFFQKLFTGADNATWDIGRILWAKVTIVYCALTSYHAVKNGVLDPQSWAIGAGAILASGGGALGLKSKTEPTDVKSSPKPLDP